METPETAHGSTSDKSSRSKEFIKEAVEQPALTRIAELRARSPFTRSEEGTASAKLLSKEGQEFSIKTVESGKDPVLDDVQQLFEDTFSAEEVDPVETLKNAVDDEDIPYRVIPVQDESGKVVATMAGAPLEMEKANGESTNEMVYFVGYAVTDPSVRKAGLAKEAYISALLDATNTAQKNGKKLAFSIGECTASSEYYWNSVGWNRIYARQAGSTEYDELPYLQPALEFDTETGKPTEDAGEVPEHLMIDGFAHKPSKEDIKSAHAALVRYNASSFSRQEFDNDRAFQTKEIYVQTVIDKFNESIDESDDLMFLDAVSRGKIRQSGFTVQNHYVHEAETANPEDEKF